MRRFEGVSVEVLLLAALACGGGGEPKAKAASVAPPAETTRVTGNGADSRRAVLFLGTSLTAGLGLEADSAFPQQIGRVIERARLPFRTVNAGESGETSAGLLQRLDWVLQQPAAVIVVETGANDGLRGQPVDGTKETIGRILDRIHSAQPDAKVVLVQMEALPNLGAAYTHAFHAMFPDLARAHGVTLMPFLLDHVAGYSDLNQNDGVHPNYQGERIVTATVWRTLGPILEGIARQGSRS